MLANDPVTFIVSGLASMRVPVTAEPVTVPLIVPVEAQVPVSATPAVKAPLVWVKVPETVAEPLVEET